MGEFEIYRSHHNPDHYVAVLAGSDHENAVGVRNSQNLVLFTSFPDDGEERLGFDAGEARNAIERDGFFAFSLSFQPREHHFD